MLDNLAGKKVNTKDGFTVMISERTAGKMPFWDRSMTPEQYGLKLKSATHADELLQTASRDRYARDFGGKHGEFAKHGWDYYKSYLTDGKKTYVADMSVAKNDDGSVLYNIGSVRAVGAFQSAKKDPRSITGSPNDRPPSARMRLRTRILTPLYHKRITASIPVYPKIRRTTQEDTP